MKIKSRYLFSGGALLGAALSFYTSWEGRAYTAYQDSGKVWTICAGVTEGVHKGMTATDAECDQMEKAQILIHEARLLACAPELQSVPDKTYIAINSWAYNVGTGAACQSTLIKRIKAGDIRGACEQLSRWVYVNGKLIKGLQNRRVNGSAGRTSERSLCLAGVPA